MHSTSVSKLNSTSNINLRHVRTLVHHKSTRAERVLAIKPHWLCVVVCPTFQPIRDCKLWCVCAVYVLGPLFDVGAGVVSVWYVRSYFLCVERWAATFLKLKSESGSCVRAAADGVGRFICVCQIWTVPLVGVEFRNRYAFW